MRRCGVRRKGGGGLSRLSPSRVRIFPNCSRGRLGVNLLVGTENGLMLLDRSGQGKVYNLITRRRFLQMDVLEGLNVLVTISGQLTGPRGTLNGHVATVFSSISISPLQGRRTSCVFIICRG